MTNYSEWMKIDLHIHSIMSNEVKKKDYNGNEYSARELLNTMINENNRISIFSITDHNCINSKLYNELSEIIEEDEYKNIVNYVIGVELDINDKTIHDSIFHCLCFFESKDVNKIDQAISDLFDKKGYHERKNDNLFPSVQKVFNTFSKYKFNDILLIPHFNNKSKGIPQNIAIEKLNYLCFNAYEDRNNIDSIQKSLKIYLNEGYDNFPFAVFSDNHNLEIYPKDKEGNQNKIQCSILGNILSPFNSIKTAFQEARMRISLSDIEGMRKINYPSKYLNKLLIGGTSFELSPYQNTIVGKFGSGKSLFLEKIKHGCSSLENHKKYSDFYDANESFKLFLDNQQFNSLDEINNVISHYKIYEFIQQENYYYKNSFTLQDAKQLFQQLNINHIFNENISYDFNYESIKKSYSDIDSLIIKDDGKNNLNYYRAFDKMEYYAFSTNYNNINLDEVIASLNSSIDVLEKLSILKIDNISVFTVEELNNIEIISSIVNKKLLLLKTLNDMKYEDVLKKKLNDYNDKFINNNAKDIKDTLEKDLNSFFDKIHFFSEQCHKFESVLTKEKYESNLLPMSDVIIDNYSIGWCYRPPEEYKSIVSKLIKSANQMDNLFKSTIKTLMSKERQFANNKNFDYHIGNYINYANSLFTAQSIEYDILKDNNSLLRRSAGEKSSLFIEFIFDLLEKDLENKENVLLILDQPEDNIDNDNIFNQIAKRLRILKLKYNTFQSIIVTHNANVAITADSENIIVANEKMNDDGIKIFGYLSGCIENKEFIDDVCNILEGGKQAMEKRTIKYGINIIRKVEENGI